MRGGIDADVEQLLLDAQIAARRIGDEDDGAALRRWRVSAATVIGKGVTPLCTTPQMSQNQTG